MDRYKIEVFEKSNATDLYFGMDTWKSWSPMATEFDMSLLSNNDFPRSDSSAFSSQEWGKPIGLIDLESTAKTKFLTWKNRNYLHFS